MGPWDCWDNDGPVAETADGTDGGLRINSLTRPCDGVYWGVNLAAGTGVGVNADLDGKDFTKIVFKLRGSVAAAEVYFFATSSGEGIGDWDGTTHDSNGGKKWYAVDHYTSDYNETTWTEIIVPITDGKSSSTMNSAFTIGGNAAGWVEIKDIDWQDADGNSVVPEYNN